MSEATFQPPPRSPIAAACPPGRGFLEGGIPMHRPPGFHTQCPRREDVQDGYVAPELVLDHETVMRSTPVKTLYEWAGAGIFERERVIAYSVCAGRLLADGVPVLAALPAVRRALGGAVSFASFKSEIELLVHGAPAVAQ